MAARRERVCPRVGRACATEGFRVNVLIDFRGAAQWYSSGLLSHFSASVTTGLCAPRPVKPCHFNYILARQAARVCQSVPHLVNRTDARTHTRFCANNLPEARFWIASGLPTIHPESGRRTWSQPRPVFRDEQCRGSPKTPHGGA